MITAIYLNPNEFSDYIVSGEHRYILELNRINVFIGENNSGKSRLLRALFHKWENLKGYDKPDIKILKNLVTGSFTSAIKHALQQIEIYGVYSESEQIRNLLNALSSNEEVSAFQDFIELNELLSRAHKNKLVGDRNKLPNAWIGQLTSSVQNWQSQINAVQSQLKEIYSPIYIPILRGLRPLSYNETENKFISEDTYLRRTVYDYFNVKKPHEPGIVGNKVFTGITFFEEISRLLLGDEN